MINGRFSNAPSYNKTRRKRTDPIVRTDRYHVRSEDPGAPIRAGEFQSLGGGTGNDSRRKIRYRTTLRAALDRRGSICAVPICDSSSTATRLVEKGKDRSTGVGGAGEFASGISSGIRDFALPRARVAMAGKTASRQFLFICFFFFSSSSANGCTECTDSIYTVIALLYCVPCV